MFAFLVSTFLACSPYALQARDEAYSLCEKRYSKPYSIHACKEGVRYVFNGNKVSAAERLCGDLQGSYSDHCYQGIRFYEARHKAISPLRAETMSVEDIGEQTALAVNRSTENSEPELFEGTFFDFSNSSASEI